MSFKKSKGILKLTLSLVTIMLATEVLAKGGGHATGRGMSGSTVWGYSPSMRVAIGQADRNRMRGVPPKRGGRNNRTNRQPANVQQAQQVINEIIVEGEQYTFGDYLQVLQDIGFTRSGAFGFLWRQEIKPKVEGEYVTRLRGTCDQTNREFRVWDMYFRHKKIDPKHTLITVYWRDGVGIYRKNQHLPTSLIWTEVSFRHVANSCNHNI